MHTMFLSMVRYLHIDGFSMDAGALERNLVVLEHRVVHLISLPWMTIF
jgi:hypothetical protein